MLKELKLKYSIVNAELRKFFVTCPKCSSSHCRVRLNFINKKGFWNYSILCNSCNTEIVKG